MSVEAPPAFESPNVVEILSVDNSKITNVSLYSGRAEITRVYQFTVKTGQNQVNISGLPNVLEQDSLRVEGRGAATIHDVTLSQIPVPDKPTTSPALDTLLHRKDRTQKALERANKAITSLQSYLDTLNVQHVNVAQVAAVMDNFDVTGEKLDDRVLELEKELVEIDLAIEKERVVLDGPVQNEQLRQRAAIGVFAEHAGDVEIALIYAVREATWEAGYDIRVDMQAKEKPITLIYKAAITQSTGEDWEDVPLILETATPTFGVDIPSLTPWALSVYRNTYYTKSKSKGGWGASRSVSMAMPTRGGGGSNFLAMDMQSSATMEEMVHRALEVSSKGNITATFQVPGTITVPSDGASHNVTVVQLELDATMSWVTVPKKDAKTHLKAKIRNASDYTLLPGVASVYVDGSFISKSDVPPVSPQESFDCPLGLDPSIRVTYQPVIKKVQRSGLYNKVSNHTFTQRITIFNTKSSGISDFKVVDQFPISEDSQITVKMLSPALPALPGSSSASDSLKNQTLKVPPPMRVQDGVLAHWDGADDPSVDLEALGRDGKFNWVCSVPSQGKLNLALSWEVNAPLNLNIVGLTQ